MFSYFDDFLYISVLILSCQLSVFPGRDSYAQACFLLLVVFNLSSIKWQTCAKFPLTVLLTLCNLTYPASCHRGLLFINSSYYFYLHVLLLASHCVIICAAVITFAFITRNIYIILLLYKILCKLSTRLNFYPFENASQ